MYGAIRRTQHLNLTEWISSVIEMEKTLDMTDNVEPIRQLMSEFKPGAMFPFLISLMEVFQSEGVKSMTV